MNSSYDDSMDYGYEPGDGQDPRPHSPASGSASGRASVGRVSVPRPAGYDDGYGPAPRPDSYGYDGGYHAGGNPDHGHGYGDRGGYGGGYDDGYAPARSGPVSPPGTGAAVGRAVVGRATVRPLGPRPDLGGDDDFDGPGGPDGPRRPGRFGRGPGGPGGPRGRGPLGRSPFGKNGKKSKTRRQKVNRIVAIIAAVIMVTGIAVVGGVFYVDDVNIPDANLAKLDAATSIFYDTKGLPKNAKPVELARLGKVNRTVVTIQQIPVAMQEAIVAAEDKKFFTNSGVDLAGMVRAAWNNVTGGERQGASTITQQYARKVADLNGITYSRKAREAVLAVKLSKTYTKEKILESYLNTADFGRNATGIEAAAQAYFQKSIKDVTPAEAMVLAGLVKAPEGKDGFDPAQNLENSKGRWLYIQGNMRELAGTHPGFLTAAEVDALKYPDIPKVDPKTLGSFGTEDGNPNGNIVNQVLNELRAKGIKDISTSGYKIYTTINQQAQAIAVKYARRSGEKNRAKAISPLDGQPDNLTAALVAIDPATGGVLAYYGGDHPTGTDMAGLNYDNNGNVFGGHPPGSTFKIYTLATALSNGISYSTYWSGKGYRTDFKSADGAAISNVGATEKTDGGPVTLMYATEASLNTVFYAVSEKLGQMLDGDVSLGGRHVAQTAGMAGVESIWAQDPKTGADKYDSFVAKEIASSARDFDNRTAFGKYKVTVLDNAVGYATFANNGVHMPTHFVTKVVDRYGHIVPAASPKLVGTKAVEPSVAADVSHVLEGVRDHYISNGTNLRMPGGRDSAVKTGTWQQGDTPKLESQNAHAWMAGYTPNIAAAVWVGNSDGGVSKPLLYCKSTTAKTCTQLVYGATIPGSIWTRFMTETINTLKLPAKSFPPSPNIGSDDAGDVASPTPTAAPTDTGQPCQLPLICPTDPPTGGTGGGGGGGGPGGGGGGPGGGTGSPSPNHGLILPSAIMPDIQTGLRE